MEEFNLRFAIAWVGACIAAFFIRYVVKRAPFKPWPGTLVAAATCFALFAIFRISRQPDDSQIMQTGLMWVLLLIVSRTILIAGDRKQSTLS